MLQAIVLGAAQGLTEFVPVSSSAHLVLLPFLLRWRIPSLAFDVAIHLGTLVALLVYFAPDLLRMLAGATRAAVVRGNGGGIWSGSAGGTPWSSACSRRWPSRRGSPARGPRSPPACIRA